MRFKKHDHDPVDQSRIGGGLKDVVWKRDGCNVLPLRPYALLESTRYSTILYCIDQEGAA